MVLDLDELHALMHGRHYELVQKQQLLINRWQLWPCTHARIMCVDTHLDRSAFLLVVNRSRDDRTQRPPVAAGAWGGSAAASCLDGEGQRLSVASSPPWLQLPLTHPAPLPAHSGCGATALWRLPPLPGPLQPNQPASCHSLIHLLSSLQFGCRILRVVCGSLLTFHFVSPG